MKFVFKSLIVALAMAFFLPSSYARPKNRRVVCFNLSECVRGNYKSGTNPMSGWSRDPRSRWSSDPRSRWSSDPRSGWSTDPRKLGKGLPFGSLEINLTGEKATLVAENQEIGDLDQNDQMASPGGGYYQVLRLSPESLAVSYVTDSGELGDWVLLQREI
jgi:hypothetical protein